MIAARQIFLGRGGGAKLPYDAEVEYLATDGLSWIDTGIPMSPGMEVIAEHMFVVSSSQRQLMGSNVSRQYYGVTTSGYIEFGALGVNASTVVANADTIYTISYKAENGDDVCSIYSGGSLLFQKSGAYYSLSGNFVIFNIGGSSQFQFVSGNRIYSFRMITGGILVRDMTPVRFTNELGQSEGAMYDRVSKQLFRNQGTGAFLYGGDVYRVPSAVGQYVQSGLVAMWDGIENAGLGLHSTGVGLTNLAGSAQLTFPSNLSYMSMGEKSLDISLVHVNTVGSKITLAANAMNLSTMTIEMCFSSGSDSTGEFGIQMVAGLLLVTGTNTALRLRTWSDTNSLAINYSKVISSTEIPITVSLTYDGTTARIYVNGALAVSYAQTFHAFNYADVVFGSTYLYNSGSIYDIRIYSRALTAEEIAANYAVDKARFNLP